MWAATRWKSNLAEINARHLAKCMASWFFNVPWFTILTTTRLSHQARTVARAAPIRLPLSQKV